VGGFISSSLVWRGNATVPLLWIQAPVQHVFPALKLCNICFPAYRLFVPSCAVDQTGGMS
jgi:hypothetical protein